MFRSVNFSIAKRHLLSKRKQTLIAILGVTFGISMFIVMSGVMDGSNQMIEESQYKITPHIRLFNESKTDRPPLLSAIFPGSMVQVAHQRPLSNQEKIKQVGAIMAALRKMPEVKGITAHVSTPVLFNFGTTQQNSVLFGVDIKDEDALFNISKRIKSGSMEALENTSNGIIISKGLAEKLSIRTGDHMTATAANGHTLYLKVTGTYSTGMGAVDNMKCYVNFNLVHNILEKDDLYITEVIVQLHDPALARRLAPVMQQQFRCQAEDWETANQPLLAGNKIRDMMKYIIAITLLVVAGFGIYNIMSMTVQNKMKDIAILKATGFSGRDVKRIFQIQSFVVGTIGALIGLGTGWLFCRWIASLPFDGGEYMDIDHLPVSFDTAPYITGLFFGIITTFLAAWFPSRRAAKTDPVEILRG